MRSYAHCAPISYDDMETADWVSTSNEALVALKNVPSLHPWGRASGTRRWTPERWSRRRQRSGRAAVKRCLRPRLSHVTPRDAPTRHHTVSLSLSQEYSHM